MSDNEMIRRGEVLAIVGPMQWSNSPIAAVAAGDAYRAIAAIPAAPAPTVKVKPLVWSRMVSGALKADAELARYVVSGGCWALLTHTHGETRHALNEQDAKAAAQSNYDARILSAIKVTP